MMKKVWIIVRNDHLGYEEVEVVGETEKKFILSTVIKRCSHKSINKKDVFYREIDVINAIIAQSADQLSFYRHCVTSEESKINQLIERKKHI